MTAKRTSLLVILLASAAGVLTLVIFVALVAIVGTRKEPAGAGTQNDEYWRASHAWLPTSSREKLNWSFVIPQLADSAIPLLSAPEADDTNETATAESDNPVPTKNVTAAGAASHQGGPPGASKRLRSGTRTFATVDVERLVESLAGKAAAEADRKVAVLKIRDAVATFSKSRSIPMVFDRSGSSINRVPVILNADGVADITDQILHELTQPPAN